SSGGRTWWVHFEFTRINIEHPQKSPRMCARRAALPESKLAHMMKVCIVGASGKLGIYMVQQALDRSYAVVGVCRERSVEKLDAFKARITVIPGATNDRE